LSGLFDFFQSASNAVADNVAGPVDLINAGLGLFGLRSKEPVGGSEWMKRWGLKRDVEMSGARLAGETAGLLSPTLLAAKAPQIAKGLLQAQENAAIPRQFNPEMGAIVYHGSPHKFDKFDSSKIGTGEGAQAYGHGLYLAESPDVARTYKNTNVFRAFDIGPEAEKIGVQLNAGGRGELIRQANANPSDPARAAKYLQYANVAAREQPVEKLEQLIRGYQAAQQGNLYKVDLPDEAIAKMLDWDKPLSQQAPEVKTALEKIDNPMFKAWQKNGAWPHISGQVLYRHLADGLTQGAHQAGKHVGASQAVRDAGIPGIRYLDQGSRFTPQASIEFSQHLDGSPRFSVNGPKGDAHFNTMKEAQDYIESLRTRNYVVFPGEEHLLKILERNGGLMGP
jgi:hypothetical protein